jgi:hypothetical protein
MSLGAIFLLSFFGPGVTGVLIFLAIARSGLKVWPIWFVGAITIVVIGFWAANEPDHSTATPILLLGGACIAFVSWGLAALVIGSVGSLDRGRQDL